MRVAVILGSPRLAGNSTTLADLFCEEFNGSDVSIARHHLNSMNIKGCQSCSACKGKSETCVVKDDLTQVLADVADADIIVLATPVYWGDISGQMKLFIDRTYSYLKPDFMSCADKHRLPPGKKLVWIQTQGGDETQFSDVFSRYNIFWDQLGFFEESYVLRGCNASLNDTVLNQGDLIRETQDLAKKILL
jgi:multimeric flavodoxin WrbA